MANQITSTNGGVTFDLELNNNVDPEHEQSHLDVAARLINEYLAEFNQLDGPRRCLAFHGFADSILEATAKAAATMELSQEEAAAIISMRVTAMELADAIAEAMAGDDDGSFEALFTPAFVSPDEADC